MSPWIAPGRVYRSATLDKAPPEDLVKWLGLSGVRTIVDFRTDHERRDSGYSKMVVDAVSYKVVPIWPKVSPVLRQSGARKRADGMLHFYRHLASQPHFQETLRALFAVLDDGTNYPMVMHCHAGVDRTGMVTALMQMVMGVPDGEIVGDYLRSSAHTQASYIEAFLQDIRSQGGPSSYLRAAGVSTIVWQFKYPLRGALASYMVRSRSLSPRRGRCCLHCILNVSPLYYPVVVGQS